RAESANLLARVDVPNMDLSVRPARGSDLAIRMARQHRLLFRCQGKTAQFLSGRAIPFANGLIAAAGDQRPGVGRESHVTDSPFLAVVGGSLLAHGKVPEADHGLGIAGSQCLLVRREAQAVDIAEVAQALAEFLSGACIPKAKGVIEAAARQDLTVQRERD